MLNRPSRLFIAILIVFMFSTTVMSPISFTKVNAETLQITALTTPVIYDQSSQALGRIKVQVPAGAVKENDVMLIKLPYSLEGGILDTPFNDDDESSETGKNYIFVPKQNNGLQKDDIKITPLGKKEFKISATKNASYSDDVTIFIILNNVSIEKGAEGPVKIAFDGPADSGFPKGEVIAAIAVTKGIVQLTAEGIDTSNSDYSFNLRIKESIHHSLLNGKNSIKLTLPSGFEWVQPTAGTEKTFYGDEIALSYTVNENELAIHVNNGESTKASMWDIPLAFTAEDDDRIINGDINANISGLTKTDIDQLKVGTYAYYGVSIFVDDEIPTIVNGKTGQNIASIKIEEQVPKSIIVGRSLSLTLPDEAKWISDDTDRDGINLGTPRVQSEGRTLQYSISGSSLDEVKLELDQLKVAVRPGFTGELGVKIEGAGFAKERIVIAEVVNPVTIKTTAVPDVVIGKSNQSMAEITISETVKGALKKKCSIQISLPQGVQFVDKPDVKVIEGNLYLNRASLIDNQTLELEIDAESTTPSTITIAGAALRIDRTVPKGSIEATISGSALIESTGTVTLNGTTFDLWKYEDTIGEVAVANVTTPVPGQPNMDKIQFKIGEKTYYVNSNGTAMDVAPFVENNRTYLPIRYVAIALGINTKNIFWDEKTRKVTIINGNRTVQLTIGSKILLLNGTMVTMDVPAQIKNGRTQLPLRFVAELFGLQVDFNEQTRTVTIQ